MKHFPDYAAASSCQHPAGSLRQLGNGETSCDLCVHVVVDRDGKPRRYSPPIYRWEQAHARTDAELLHELTKGTEP